MTRIPVNPELLTWAPERLPVRQAGRAGVARAGGATVFRSNNTQGRNP